ncbi:NAD(+) diphosphatase [Georgenia sp. TF02-10]|uniref:NAD(+) diphosphatase n=1 Tax=Georgenia sp. TF02-10 TaxID=2917725 RepID=UPI001FA72B26|nr:NAD(+) diphosphatase [Georgenia sp. TF02-10]UNX53947.1 NAD(+) diphosphatase [Georgenia sp. TF02-10]
MENLPLARATVDPDAVARTRPGLVTDLAADPGTRVVLVRQGRVATKDGALDLRAPADVTGATWDPERLAYLGRDESGRYLALTLPETLGEERDLDGVPVQEDAALVSLVEGLEFSHLRDVGDVLPDRDAGLATTAVSLAAWHARHPRCPRCGEVTEVIDAGWVRRCTADRSLHYPRTDPAVIMAVTDAEDRILLGHAAHWPDRRFSTLAGYVEPGESVETAVRREVAEEVGIAVGQVEFVASQPWPFPASLMLGFRARVADGAAAEVRVDGVEISAARFFTRAALGEAVQEREVLLPTRSSIALALIEDWFGGSLR